MQQVRHQIYYYCPDIDKPSGGIRRIYRHVEILAGNGFPASVLHNKAGFRTSWFSSSAPVEEAGAGEIAFNREDILVIPEVCYEVLRSAKQVVNNPVAMVLNWGYVFLGLHPCESYKTFGIQHIIAGCEYIREFVQSAMGLHSEVVTAGVDTDMFRPGEKKDLVILCTPQKNPNQLKIIECVFRSKYPEFASVPFIRSEIVAHDQMARQMRSTAIYLTCAFPEGIVRPVLEAMACGCIVVGFHGKGGLEYMRDGENCYRAEDGDVLGAADALAAAVRAWEDKSASVMQTAARETALRYSNQVEEEAVLRYWRNFPRNIEA